jgi:protein-tyrosine phosphatase
MNHPENIVIEGALNFRDIGGYRIDGTAVVRKGVLFRSGDLWELTAADKVKLSEIGLRTVIDMRTPNEIRSKPDRRFSGKINTVEIPFIPSWGDPGLIKRFSLLLKKRGENETFIRDFYKQIVFEHKLQMKRIFEIISDENNLPALIHCTAGKDRTGIVVALIHLLCGVSEKDVLHDYLLTNTFLKFGIKKLFREFWLLSLFHISMEKIQPLLEARADYLKDVLALMHKEYGGAAEYLAAGCGVDPDMLKRLKMHLRKNRSTD